MKPSLTRLRVRAQKVDARKKATAAAAGGMGKIYTIVLVLGLVLGGGLKADVVPGLEKKIVDAFSAAIAPSKAPADAPALPPPADAPALPPPADAPADAERKPMYSLQVNLGERGEVPMLVYEGDNALLVAQEFAAKYGLAEDIVPGLQEAIVNHHNTKVAPPEKKLLYDLKVTVDGKEVPMLVYEGDNALVVAQEFAAKHGLAEDMVPKLQEAVVNHHNTQAERKPLYSLNVNLGERGEVPMLVYEGDNALVVAQEFAAKYGLAEDIVPKLQEAIVNHHNTKVAPAEKKPLYSIPVNLGERGCATQTFELNISHPVVERVAKLRITSSGIFITNAAAHAYALVMLPARRWGVAVRRAQRRAVTVLSQWQVRGSGGGERGARRGDAGQEAEQGAGEPKGGKRG